MSRKVLPVEPIAISNDAIDRILDAVGADRIPASFDRQSFADALRFAAINYRTTGEWARSATPAQEKRLEKLSEATREITNLLDDFTCEWISKHRSYIEEFETETPAPWREDLRKSMQQLNYDINFLLRLVSGQLDLGPPDFIYSKGDMVRADPISVRSRFERFAGVILPEVFRQHFKIEPTLQRRLLDDKAIDAVADGPFVRFAHRTLIELGITYRGKNYAKESILKALQDVRGGHFRRKPRPR